MDSYQTIFSLPSQKSDLLEIKQLFKKSWQIYRERMGVLWGIMFLILIDSFLFFIPQAIYKKINLVFFIVITGIFSLLAIFIAFWLKISLLYAIKEREAKIGIKESLKRGWPKTLSFFWLSLLNYWIIIGGVVLFLIPGIIFYVWFSLRSYVLVSEDLKGIEALFRSKQWVKGKWKSVFWRFFLINFLGEGINLFLGFIAARFHLSFIESIFYLLFTPFTATFGFLIYEDLRRLKGDLPFEPPSKRTKIKYLLVAVLGFLSILIILGLLLFLIFYLKKLTPRVKIGFYD